ncbi:hypothetical protein MKX08_002161 [Trichoderma sp. CBMAI-0020]|nr:hypothetical protein MKX08_002161 [Trichoderma sp. CBMAI-0020]WOD46519.1 hypothetical protein [Trichoderma atroviride]
MAGDLVLLTGGTGMIGFKTLVEVLKAGYKVRAAVRNQAGFDRIASLKPLAPYVSNLESIIVPDIAAPGAYDEAVKGVKYVVHVASPLAQPVDTEEGFQSEVIQPAIRGTLGILEAAHKTTGIERIVITASILSVASFESLASGVKTDERTRAVNTVGPYASAVNAYQVSKALAFEATNKFIAEKKPAFSVINIMPAFVIGRDDTITDASNIVRGSNAFLIGPLLGHARDQPLIGAVVHVDDVAKMHVQSLDSSIVKGNEDFLAYAPPSIDWADSFEIVKRRFPEAYADGVFKFESIPRPITGPVNVDSSKAEKTFGKFKSFEEQTVSVVEHYLELIGRK